MFAKSSKCAVLSRSDVLRLSNSGHHFEACAKTILRHFATRMVVGELFSRSLVGTLVRWSVTRTLTVVLLFRVFGFHVNTTGHCSIFKYIFGDNIQCFSVLTSCCVSSSLKTGSLTLMTIQAGTIEDK
jgi:hypothetical protein